MEASTIQLRRSCEDCEQTQYAGIDPPLTTYRATLVPGVPHQENSPKHATLQNHLHSIAIQVLKGT